MTEGVICNANEKWGVPPPVAAQPLLPQGGKVYMLCNHLLLGRQEVNRMRIIWIWMVDWLYRLA